MVIAQVPVPPCWFYGTVSVDGSPAQDNVNVTAVIKGTSLAWTTKTKNGTYGWIQRNSTSFYVPSDNLTTSDKDGGVNGDVIEFYVSGVKANQTATFESLSMKRVDLVVGTTPDGDGSNGLASNPYLLYTIIIITIVTGIGLGTVLWVRRKGHLKLRSNATRIHCSIFF